MPIRILLKKKPLGEYWRFWDEGGLLMTQIKIYDKWWQVTTVMTVKPGQRDSPVLLTLTPF